MDTWGGGLCVLAQRVFINLGNGLNAPKLFALLWLLLASSVSTFAQTSAPQFVYGSAPQPGVVAPPSYLVGFSKNPQTGTLTAIPGSPFNNRLEGGPMSVDGQGKFLFVANPTSNDISMFTIDQSTGALTEVPNSPFAAPSISLQDMPPSGLVSITGEPTGQFVFAGYQFLSGTDFLDGSAIAMFSIDTSGASPVLTPVSVMGVPNPFHYGSGGTPISLLTDPKGLYLYVGVGIAVTGDLTGGAYVLSIQPPSSLGYRGTAATPFLSYGRSYAIDPLDRFYYGVGGDVPFIVPCMISPVDGTATTCPEALQYLGFGPTGPMQIESSGHFLYIPTDVTANSASTPGVAVFSIDQTTGIPTQVTTISLSAAQSLLIADPMGPYLYSSNSSAIRGYQVDSSTGNLTELSGSPYSVNGGVACCESLAITGTLPVPIIGPAATIFPSSASPFNATAGMNSAAQTFSITNNGTQTLNFTAISFTGTDPTSFSEANTCASTLPVNASCTVNVTFNPASAATFTANLQIVDNAANSPQLLALTGTGVGAVPGVSFSPNPLSFSGSTPVAGSQGPSAITVTNDGTGALHVTAVSVSGANPNDFSQTNNCVGVAVAVNATCTVSVTFTPQAVGVRTATVVLTSDAPGGTQSDAVEGTATAPFQLSPTPSSMTGTMATVAAGQTANYALQLTPAAGFQGMVSFACTGAPSLANCTVMPTSVNITNANIVPFTVSVTTTGNASSSADVLNTNIPGSGFTMPWARIPLLADGNLACLVGLCLLLVFVIRGGESGGHISPLTRAAGVVLVALCVAAVGCGGGSSSPPPSTPQGTPQGTYTLTVTATPGSVQPQTITLTLTVH